MDAKAAESIDPDEFGLMVVDDDEDILFTVYSLFKKRPFPVVIARSGHECLDFLDKGFKGVVLMDIMMPGMDGWETVEEIVKRGYAKDLVISMFTAKDVPDTTLDHLKTYVLDYITKPFEPEHLKALVDDYLALLG